MSPAAPLPPLPAADLPAGLVWPVESGREILRRIPREGVIHRDDLVGRQGMAEGSGTSDTVLLQAGGWCLKTSQRRRFADLDEGRAALLALVRRKLLLGPLLPRDTVITLVPEAGGGGWLWTLCPWISTLRRQMSEAVERGDQALLASALAAFATAAIEAMSLAARHGAHLDVHPSNFALTLAGLWYVDDDIGSAATLPAIGYGLLQRVEEYAAWEAAVDVYLSALEESLPLRLKADEARRIGLAEALEQAVVRSAAAEAARSRIRRAVWRCRD